MRVFISSDIEGITGIVSWSQAEGPEGSCPDWAFARRMYTHDVSAAVRGAKAAGATQVVVIDAHNLGKNLLIDELPAGTELISGLGAGVHGMMEGIQAGFDTAMLVGYHGMAGTARGVMEHALAGGLHRFWMNGNECGEMGISAATAGAFGVPLCFVSSDELGCAEATALVPEVQTFATKTGIGRFMAKLKHPSETGTGIENVARRAVQRARNMQPYKVEGEVTIRCEFHTSEQVDLGCTLENSTRVDGYTMEFVRPDYLSALRATYVMFQLAARGRKSGD